jgi:hypothetical protein
MDKGVARICWTIPVDGWSEGEGSIVANSPDALIEWDLGVQRGKCAETSRMAPQSIRKVIIRFAGERRCLSSFELQCLLALDRNVRVLSQ